MNSTKEQTTRVVIIGSGVSGILLGIKLLEVGISDFVILEKGSDLGGTWRENRYPGLTCDVPSHLYVYSFEPNPNWRNRFATGPDIWRYYDRVAGKYRVKQHMQFSREVTSAHWEDGAWTVECADGSITRADFVISAVGRLHHPAVPQIEGLESFAGAHFHTARWPQNFRPEGQRIGIIGTGSTATQLVSALASRADALTVFQRTPQWVFPVENPPMPRWRRLVYNLFPGVLRRYINKLEAELFALVENVTGSDRTFLRRACEAGLDQIRDPVLREKLRPDYEPGCKRLVMSPDFHRAIQSPNVCLVTTPIERVVPEGVRTTDGEVHRVDALVLATGFKADAYMRPMKVEGANGVSLDELWRDGPLNYRSVAMPSMPNFFMINGPYSPGGSAPVVSIAEAHVRYVVQLIQHVVETGEPLMPVESTTRRLLDEVRDAARKTVWATGGCESWYLDKDGVPLYNPLTIAQLREQMDTPVWSDFETPGSASASYAATGRT